MKIHRDRSRDDVRAAKDNTPLRGRPEKAAGGVGHLGRAARPPFGQDGAAPSPGRRDGSPVFLASRLLRTITATSDCEYRP